MKLNSDNYSLTDFVSSNSSDLLEKTTRFYSFITDASDKKTNDSYMKQSLSPSAGRIRLKNKDYGTKGEVIQMNTANYLGLASHPRVIKAAQDALEQYGASTGGVPLIAGTTDIHKKLERELAKFKNLEEVVLFQTGYAANTGTIAAMVGRHDWVVYDKQVHASIIDGISLARSRFKSFQHSDADDLAQRLEAIRLKHKNSGILVVIEGVYGIDGDVPPLPEILEITEKYDARLMIDDCHATGILGERGTGLAEYFNIDKPIDIVMDSLSKVLGSLGGCIGTTRQVAEYLRYYANPIVFSVGLSPVSVASALAALELLKEESSLIRQVQENSRFMRESLSDLGVGSVNRSASAIMSIEIKNEVKMRNITTELLQEGLWVEGIPYPAVPRGQERIRLRVNAKHTKSDLEHALLLIRNKLHSYNVI